MNDYKNINTYSIIDTAWDDEDRIAEHHERTLLYDSKCTLIIDTGFYILEYLMFHCEYVVKQLFPVHMVYTDNEHNFSFWHWNMWYQHNATYQNIDWFLSIWWYLLFGTHFASLSVWEFTNY